MKFQTKWIWLTFAGWVLGLVAAIVISPLINSLTGKYLVQSPLPIIMCVMIGLFQSFLLRKHFPNNFTWLWIYLVSFVVCFTSIESVADLLDVKPEIYVPVGTIVSGIASGYLQARLVLHLRGKATLGWTLKTGFSWLAAIFIVFIVPLLIPARQGPAIIYMIAILAGGFILGFLTKNISRYFDPA